MFIMKYTFYKLHYLYRLTSKISFFMDSNWFRYVAYLINVIVSVFLLWHVAIIKNNQKYTLSIFSALVYRSRLTIYQFDIDNFIYLKIWIGNRLFKKGKYPLKAIERLYKKNLFFCLGYIY